MNAGARHDAASGAACDFAELSPAQRRLWFLDQYAPCNAFYNEPLLALRVEGPLDMRALQAALDDLVARQDSLRTTFPAIDGRPLQRISRPEPCRIHVVELSGPGGFAALRRVFRFASAEAHRTFNLAAGPLLVPSLVRMDDTDHLFTAAMHHIITDGWSLRVFLSELVALYSYHAGLSATAPESPRIRYVDYARWESSQLTEARLAELLAHWRQRLDGASPYIDFMTDFSRPAAPSFLGRTVRRVLPAAATDGLRALAQRYGVSLYVVLLAAFKCLIARLSGCFDILVGTPTANRHLPEAEALVGLFVNVIVLRTRLSGNPPFASIVRAVADTVVDALEHQMIPFDVVVRELCSTRDSHRQPFVQLFFAHHNFPHVNLEVPRLRITRWDIPQEDCKFDLVLFTHERSGGALDVRMSYSRDVYRWSTAVGLIAAYLGVLERLVQDDSVRLSALVKPSAFYRPTCLHDHAFSSC